MTKELTEKNEYLLTQLNDLARIVNEIDRDLSGYSTTGSLRPLVPSGDLENGASEREVLEAKRQRIATNLSRLRAELKSTDSLWRTAARQDSSARAQLAASGETLAMFRTLAETRAVQFADFEERIDSLKIANQALADERDRMRDSLSRLSTRVGRVYYVVGTRDELLSSGVLREIMIVRQTWRGAQRERQLVPAADAELARLLAIRTAFGPLASGSDEDGADVEQQGVARVPDNGEFRELDRYRDTVLSLPTFRRARLRIVSSQDLRYADGVGRDGRINASEGRLRITDPEGFWEGGRYLVVVIER
jgi:hypothetical protein